MSSAGNETIKKIDIKEFLEEGYLQEVNRRFFHPLGMALEVQVDEDGTYSLGGVWDYRDDPEGMSYRGLNKEEALRKATNVQKQLSDKLEYRGKHVGYGVQPIWDTTKGVS